MTNKEWLDYLAHNAPDELAAWFDAEHVENQERALDGDTAALEREETGPIKEFVGLMQQITKLTAERDELQAQVDELNELNEYHALQYELASEDADRLQAQVDNLTADLNKEIYERERYREKFGKCLDYADAIHALMDDEGLA